MPELYLRGTPGLSPPELHIAARAAASEFVTDAPPSPDAKASGFQFQAIDMMLRLTDKLLDDIATLENEKIDARHAVDIRVLELQAQIALAEKDVDEQSEMKAK